MLDFTTLRYDELGRLSGIQYEGPNGENLMNETYQRDPVSDITLRETEHGIYSYVYDDVRQLIRAEYPTLPTDAFTYDLMGNRLSDLHANTYAYNELNQIQRVGDTQFSFDENGSMSIEEESGVAIHYAYNLENRLEAFTKDGIQAYYEYDPMGLRLKKNVNGQIVFFLYNHEGLIGEYDEQGQKLFGYCFKPNSPWGNDPLLIEKDDSFSWYLNDHLGAPLKIANQMGEIVWFGEREVFGDLPTLTIQLINNNLSFTSQYHGVESGLNFNFQRYFNPNLGSYISKDPLSVNKYRELVSLRNNLGLSSKEPILSNLINLNSNLYGFVQNTPLNRVDLYGLACFFGKRRLDGMHSNPWRPNAWLDDLMNIELYHEHIFFHDGDPILPTDLGFMGSNQILPDAGSLLGNYERSSGDYNCCILWKAAQAAKPQTYCIVPIPGRDNCQTWAEAVREKYNELENDPQVQKECCDKYNRRR